MFLIPVNNLSNNIPTPRNRLNPKSAKTTKITNKTITLFFDNPNNKDVLLSVFFFSSGIIFFVFSVFSVSIIHYLYIIFYILFV